MIAKFFDNLNVILAHHYPSLIAIDKEQQYHLPSEITASNLLNDNNVNLQLIDFTIRSLIDLGFDFEILHQKTGLAAFSRREILNSFYQCDFDIILNNLILYFQEHSDYFNGTKNHHYNSDFSLANLKQEVLNMIPSATNFRRRKIGPIVTVAYDIPKGLLMVRRSRQVEDHQHPIDKRYWFRAEGDLLKKDQLNLDTTKKIKLIKQNLKETHPESFFGSHVYIYQTKRKIKNCLNLSCLDFFSIFGIFCNQEIGYGTVFNRKFNQISDNQAMILTNMNWLSSTFNEEVTVSSKILNDLKLIEEYDDK